MNRARRRLLTAASVAALSPRLALGRATTSIGVLSPTTKEASEDFRLILAELRALGFDEGRNLRVQWEYADDHEERLATLARKLVIADVNAILSVGSPSTRAAMAATSRIPIVTAIGDPVGSGIAMSESRPGRNVTGLSWGLREQAYKVTELQRALVPGLQQTFLIVDGHDQGPLSMIPMYAAAAKELGIRFEPVHARTRSSLDHFLSQRGRNVRVGAMTFTRYDVQPADLAQRAKAGRIALFGFRAQHFVEAGGAASHGFFHRYEHRRMASLLAAVLKGTPAPSLPFEMPDVEWFAVNRTTCHQLGLSLSPPLLLRADLIVD